MKNSKIIKIVTKVQLLSWVIFIISDLVQELIKNSDIYFWFPLLFVFIIPILYFRKENELCNNIDVSKFKFFILSTIIWIIETAVIGSCLWFAVLEGLWIEQHSLPGGIWNGLEYLGFPFILAIIPICIIIIVKIIKFIFHIIKKEK